MQHRHGQEADPRETRLRERLETIRSRSAKSSPWRSSTQYLSRLVNQNGFVPVKTRLSREDIAFLAGAREDVLAFAELGVRLLDLHRPQEAGGISSDPDNPIRRCRACMSRWPCPTFRTMAETLDP
ncbi:MULTISPECIES: hypothetical protein [Actinomadura]|uniref:Uncharacterized protein n=2 Tax=Actinomadura TaxID=1988 RepID=A0A5D0NZ24_9ACTN|nr:MULTISPECIES: hypothetical protein [Actinomadura]TYB49384.1 hypothetical protein FXF69_09930 [Actinomadura chibensis]TYK50511.1 hypothetical protein FXF68_08275 [Actinomadura decatromicini]